MRHLSNKKVLLRSLNYAVLNKNSKEITIYRYKTQVADKINVSTRTLDRNMPYENDHYAVYLIANVV